MQIINTPIFNKKIQAAIRQIKRNKIKPCSDGGMINIISEYTRNGKWQVEYIHDTRFFKHPYIAAFFFSKYKGQQEHMADYVKYKELN